MLKYSIILTLAAAFIAACQPVVVPESYNFPNTSEIVGLASPINLQPGKTDVVVADFFPETEIVDSITSQYLTVELTANKETVSFTETEALPVLSEVLFWAKGSSYSILAKKSPKQLVEFTFDAKGESYWKIKIKGEMNSWNAKAGELIETNGIWKISFMVSPGKYQYLYMIDGKESLDPNNAVKVSNGAGGFNSLLVVGTETTKPFITTQSYLNNEIVLGTSQDSLTWFVYWENHRINAEIDFDNKISVSIPEHAKTIKRSHIRVWAFNANGVTNDLLIPLENGQALTDVSKLERTDKQNYIMYNLMVDRFANADTTNDRPLNIPTVHPRADYHGGDIKGITAKIKDGYFQKLGINTVWMSPIVKNPEGAFGKWPDPETQFSAYHGYWPISFTEIDDRMGTAAELKELIELAHKNDLNVILDYVANHIHNEHPMYTEHPDWFTELYLPDGSLNTERWDEYRLTTWFDVFLPTIDLEKQEVYEPLTDSAVYWFENYDIDGFRHDATKHIPEVFWRTLTRKLRTRIMKPQNRTLYQIGETYGSPELISSYVNSGQLDGQFDFNVFDAAVNAFALDETNFDMLDMRINQSLTTYGYHNLMGNISGNQDRARFMSYADGSVSFSEDSKKAGWTREITVQNNQAYNKLAMLNAWNMTIPGVPIIFYGDEYGMFGGNDPDNRKMMRFDNLNDHEEKLRTEVTELVNLRKNHMSLLYGDFKTIYNQNQVFAFTRNYFGETALVIFNKTDKPVMLTSSDIQTSVKLGSQYWSADYEINTKVPANSYTISFFK